ncbi:MAG: type II secretion system F family protein, partial [Halobacteriaceae archaeon]
MGMSLATALQTIRKRGMGRLNVELNRISRDLRTNAQAMDALRRSANRVRSPMYTRTVILLSAASEAASRLGPVIEALSDR